MLDPHPRVGALPARRIRPALQPVAGARTRTELPRSGPKCPRSGLRCRPEPERYLYRPLSPACCGVESLPTLARGAALEAQGRPDFTIHVAVGDSLLHGARFHLEETQVRQQTFVGEELFRDELQHFYDTEDREALHLILGRQYHVVVGNPPYITVEDKALNQEYRRRFPDSCRGKYSLAAPFMERFFDCAIRGEPPLKWDPFAKERGLQAAGVSSKAYGPELFQCAPSSQSGSGLRPAPAGYVGMITSNSFMKREFGKALIEECIPRWDLTHVLDCSGAYLPGTWNTDSDYIG